MHLCATLEFRIINICEGFFRKLNSKIKMSPCIGAGEEHQRRGEGDGAGPSHTQR